eukprot:29350-Pelagococcus_subviridis.AAC.14
MGDSGFNFESACCLTPTSRFSGTPLTRLIYSGTCGALMSFAVVDMVRTRGNLLQTAFECRMEQSSKRRTECGRLVGDSWMMRYREVA